MRSGITTPKKEKEKKRESACPFDKNAIILF